MLEDMTVIQKDFYRLEEWASRNVRELKNDKVVDLHLQRQNPLCWYRWTGLVAALLKRTCKS